MAITLLLNRSSLPWFRDPSIAMNSSSSILTTLRVSLINVLNSLPQSPRAHPSYSGGFEVKTIRLGFSLRRGPVRAGFGWV